MSDTPEAPVLSPEPETTEGVRRRSWIPITVVVLGVLSIGMLIGTNWIREQLMIQDVALVHAIGEIQTREAISHLWIEEFVTGDEVHLDEAWRAQDRSAYLIDAILKGGTVGQGRLVLRPVTDPDLRAKAAIIQEEIDQFRAIAERRQAGYERGEDVQIGSPIDTEYDTVFNLMLEKLQALEVDVSASLDRAHAQSALLFRTILIAWVMLVSLAVTGLWTRERRQLAAEAALRESEAQLRQSQKMEAVGRLAGGLAHDINNYLAAMTAQCELVKMRPDDSAKTSHRMDAVMETASKAAGLIQRLLTFSRREALQPRVVSMNEVVGDLEPIFGRLIGEDVTQRLQLPEDLWNVKVDPGQLEQIIVNLTVNAREAMLSGGTLTIATSNFQAGADRPNASPPLGKGEYVELRVSDTGIGIPEEIRDRIFEPFVTSKDKTTSSGLGLATVYSIVHQNKGAIEVASSPGQGSRFSIFLPRSHESVSRATRSTERAVEAVGGSQKILLVEDNDDLRESTREALEMLGYAVTTAAEGLEALSIFEEQGEAFDLLITDIVMPGPNGREVAEQMQTRRGDLPVIFVSGYTDDVILHHGVVQDEVNYLPKPFTVPALATMIREVLDSDEA